MNTEKRQKEKEKIIQYEEELKKIENETLCCEDKM